MVRWILAKLKWLAEFPVDVQYLDCIRDLVSHPALRLMENYKQHGNINCLEHCLYVSYYSYRFCKKRNLDYRSAARGGLLHDFFLYDWHDGTPCKGLHAFIHPQAALKNAAAHFSVNDIEKDIISKHMWPLTTALPKYPETYVVILVDKYCALMETGRLCKNICFHKLQTALP